jgi:hypothetical protein
MASSSFHVALLILSAGLIVPCSAKRLVSTVKTENAKRIEADTETNASSIETEDTERIEHQAAAQTQCGGQCKMTLEQLGKDLACSFEECKTCGFCLPSEPVSSEWVPPVNATGCAVYYREVQVGLKCGKHAVNAVLANSGKPKANESELDQISRSIGAPSNGDDYDIAVLQFLMMNKGVAVDQLGECADRYCTSMIPRKIETLVAGVGTSDDVRNQFAWTIEDNLDWVICNPGGHWITYFKDQDSGDFCNLDSMAARRGDPAATVSLGALKSLVCQGIIIPTGQ